MSLPDERLNRETHRKIGLCSVYLVSFPVLTVIISLFVQLFTYIDFHRLYTFQNKLFIVSMCFFFLLSFVSPELHHSFVFISNKAYCRSFCE